MIEIHLEAHTTSSLDWSQEKKRALTAIASGKKILWVLDLGLFHRLKMPLSHPSQFMTLSLALDHFRDSIWREFHSFSSGVSLYQGSGDFLSQILIDEKTFAAWLVTRFKSLSLLNTELGIQAASFEDVKGLVPDTEEGILIQQLFCSDVAADYLRQLAARIPDEIPVYLQFNALPEDALVSALLTNPERFGRIQIHASSPFSWKTDEEHPIGICMPPLETVLPSQLIPFRSILKDLNSTKLIPEEQLTLAWDGLETLSYSEKCLSKQGLRKLQGFIAAGGQIKNLID